MLNSSMLNGLAVGSGFLWSCDQLLNAAELTDEHVPQGRQFVVVKHGSVVHSSDTIAELAVYFNKVVGRMQNCRDTWYLDLPGPVRILQCGALTVVSRG